MQYFGGKARISKQIAEFIQPKLGPRTYWEPFCGGCWVLYRVQAKRKFGSDLNKSLILLWQALQNGWKPPNEISEEEYMRLSKADDSALRAFVGFGCSFAGKWFGGYARSNVRRNYASNAKNSLITKLAGLENTKFIHNDYRKVFNSPRNMVIYCDPPYQGTTQYGAIGDFDSQSFWSVMRKWSKHNIVLISEYKAPNDFACVWKHETKTDIRTTTGRENRTEMIFKMES